tara:strand:- start:30 stop:284 length:255 start_codon:yes stop_codon:yes gene_type:complete
MVKVMLVVLVAVPVAVMQFGQVAPEQLDKETMVGLVDLLRIIMAVAAVELVPLVVMVVVQLLAQAVLVQLPMTHGELQHLQERM